MYIVKEKIDRYIELIKVYVFDVFDEIAEGFHHVRRKPWYIIIDEVKSSGLPKGSIIADLGAGTGRHTIPLAELGYRVISMDISPNMIKLLWKTSKNKHLDSLIDTFVGDILFLPLRERSVHMIILVAVLHHIPLKHIRKQVLEVLKKVLKDEGLILITVWSLLQPKYFIRAIMSYLSGKVADFGDVLIPWRHKGRKYLRFYHLFRKKELLALVQITGYKVLKQYTYNPTSRFFPQNYVVLAKKG